MKLVTKKSTEFNLQAVLELMAEKKQKTIQLGTGNDGEKRRITIGQGKSNKGTLYLSKSSKISNDIEHREQFIVKPAGKRAFDQLMLAQKELKASTPGVANISEIGPGGEEVIEDEIDELDESTNVGIIVYKKSKSVIEPSKSVALMERLDLF